MSGEHSSLDLQAKHGDELVRSAALVGDQDDFHSWREQRNAWLKAAIWTILSADCEDSTVSAFREAVRVPRPLADWRLALPDELAAVRAGVEVLRGVNGRAGRV